MRRIFHPYTKWEDWQAGVWRQVSKHDRAKLLDVAVTFTGNAQDYGGFMLKVTRQWRFACEHHLTDTGMNRRAWLGHAAACMAHGIPEDVTREAWGMLSDEQRQAADAVAEEAISQWEAMHATKNQQLCLFMESQGIPGWNT